MDAATKTRLHANEAKTICKALRLVEHEEHLQPIRLLLAKGYTTKQIVAGYTVPIFAD